MADAFYFEIEGLDEVIAKLNPDLYGVPVRGAVSKMFILMSSVARDKAPYREGTLRNSIGYEVDRGSPPGYAALTSDVLYAPFQEFGTRYIEGKHFFQGAVDETTGERDHILDEAAQEIAERWSS